MQDDITNEITKELHHPDPSFEDFKAEILQDYHLANISRHASLIGRKEVLTGKAKFGIFGDGKEVAQIAMAKAFEKGDFRSGYYRDQTFMFACGTLTVEQYFSQLYAHASLEYDPASAGRQMNSHFATRSLNPDGTWKDLMEIKNSSADVSPTAGQMSRSVGLALASKLYKHNEQLDYLKNFSNKGNEVVFATIGDASLAEGVFWETVNAAGVLKVPLIISVWDDGYGISVPREFQTTKGISDLLQGFKKDEGSSKGIEIYRVKGWDYPALVEAYQNIADRARESHIPAVVHVQELTQQQGHSTSGSHERYKSPERLQFEKDFDCIKKMREWILESGVATDEELDEIEAAAKKEANEAKRNAWSALLSEIKGELSEVSILFDELAAVSTHTDEITEIKKELQAELEPLRRHLFKAVKKTLRIVRNEDTPARQKLIEWKNNASEANYDRYSSHLYSESSESALKVEAVPAVYSENSPSIPGYDILNKCFDLAFTRDSRLVAFGEDVGKIGGVNQAFHDLQEKFGKVRIFDTGIRENTIIGQGIGLAMRGLRPIAEIQYLDYLLYGLQPLSDDLATVQYRTKGGQKAPVIVRTRGHRLEGIWHTGSPIGMLISALRGIYLLVPRNFTQAAGFYNTMLESDDPALIIECLNGYRIRETLPDNVGEFKLPLGIPEVLEEGTDVTLVTYGSCVRIAQEALEQLKEVGISCELIDVQTLLPFDLHHVIVESLKKTNRIVFLDEDFPGGATAYMMRKVLEEQNGYFYLDSQPKTITAKEHRGAFGSDGDYFSKPAAEDVFEGVYELMHEAAPHKYPMFY